MSLNDSRWGRSGDGGREDPPTDPKDDREQNPAERPVEDADERPVNEADFNRYREDRQNTQAPRRGEASDLDQLWDEFNRTVNTILGKSDDTKRPTPSVRSVEPEEPRRPNARLDEMDDEDEEPRERRTPPPEPPRATPPQFQFPAGLPQGGLRGIAMLAAVAILGWAATGVYIVPEGQIGVVTTFGKYSRDTAAGINWHLPWPVQDADLVDVSSVRKVEIGIRGAASRLREALMLTDDENIVDVQFNVQYRIRPHQAKEFLFRTRDPDQSVFQAAESAMREVVGRRKMDSVLFESKQEIAENVKALMQTMLDRYTTGIEVMSVAIQNAQPPEQVQAAFNDAVKAGQDRERQINEGEAYANSVVPKAKGFASRLVQEAEGYRARVVETATGETERFEKVYAEYSKAPQVTRERLYVDTMRDVYAASGKVFVDSKSGNSMFYLPLDKMMEKQPEAPAAAAAAAPSTTVPAAQPETVPEPDARTLLRQRGR